MTDPTIVCGCGAITDQPCPYEKPECAPAPPPRVVCPAARVEHELVPTCPVCNRSLESHEGWDGRERIRLVPKVSDR